MKILIEILLVFAIGLGCYYEDSLIELEEIIAWYIKKQFKKAYRAFYGVIFK